MHGANGVAIPRRDFIASSIAATVGAAAALAVAEESATRSSCTIPPVQAWDPRSDSFAPYFPIGWYSFGPSARIEELADNGANTALYAGMGTEAWELGDTLQQMDVAKELGVKIVVGLHGAVVGTVQFGKPSTYGVVVEYVKALNEHPAMLGWQLGDEFSVDAAPRINDTVRLLRELGSKHQTWQVHPHTWSQADVRQLMAHTDVCSYDGYTYIEDQPEFANKASARILAWQQAKAELIQTEGWAGNVNVTQAVGCLCGDSPFRFPTVREYRWNVFSAISTAGARGTMNWIYSYWGGFYADDPQRFFDFRDHVVLPVNREQRMIARAMESGYNVGVVRSNLDEPTSITIPPATGPRSKFNKVGHILLYDVKDEKYFLIVSNNESQEHDVRLTLSDLPARVSSLAVEEPHHGRELELRNEGGGRYALQDRLAGYDVAIYVLR
jgi:hypothetical protein